LVPAYSACASFSAKALATISIAAAMYFTFFACVIMFSFLIGRNSLSVVDRGEQDKAEDARGCCGFKKAAPGPGAGFPVLCFFTSVTLNSRLGI
jgi:hypothetical protein